MVHAVECRIFVYSGEYSDQVLISCSKNLIRQLEHGGPSQVKAPVGVTVFVHLLGVFHESQ